MCISIYIYIFIFDCIHVLSMHFYRGQTRLWQWLSPQTQGSFSMFCLNAVKQPLCGQTLWVSSWQQDAIRDSDWSPLSNAQRFMHDVSLEICTAFTWYSLSMTCNNDMICDLRRRMVNAMSKDDNGSKHSSRSVVRNLHDNDFANSQGPTECQVETGQDFSMRVDSTLFKNVHKMELMLQFSHISNIQTKQNPSMRSRNLWKDKGRKNGCLIPSFSRFEIVLKIVFPPNFEDGISQWKPWPRSI